MIYKDMNITIMNDSDYIALNENDLVKYDTILTVFDDTNKARILYFLYHEYTTKTKRILFHCVNNRCVTKLEQWILEERVYIDEL